MKGVAITLPVQWSAESWELVFKIRRLTAHSLVYLQAECAYTNNDQILIPILIPHSALNAMNR